MAESTKFPTRPTYSVLCMGFLFYVFFFFLLYNSCVCTCSFHRDRWPTDYRHSCWFCAAPVADGRENHSFVFGGLDRKILLCARFPLLGFCNGHEEFLRDSCPTDAPLIQRNISRWFEKNSSWVNSIRGRRYLVVNIIISKKKISGFHAGMSHGCWIYRLWQRGNR